MEALLELDKVCFDQFWQFDKRSFSRAKKATRHNVSRIIKLDGATAAYCLTGATGKTGYIQRLGVDPAHRQRSLATHLIQDSLTWLYHHGCDAAMVNTQLHNVAAQNLYLKLGFELESEGLVVLKWQKGS